MLNRSHAPDLVRQTRNAIARQLGHGPPSIHLAAAATGASVRRLQRRLAAAGTTYRCLVDEVRRDTACRLLERPEFSMAAVSAALSYTDPSHFSRAFARWTGMTPRAYRAHRIAERRSQVG